MAFTIPNEFRMNNGLSGLQHIERMPTGFRFPAVHMSNKDSNNPRIHFQVRYIVGDDGKVYVGVEMTDLFEEEKQQSLDLLKQIYSSSGYTEIDKMSDHGWYATDTSSIGVDCVTLNIVTREPNKPLQKVTQALVESGAADPNTLEFIRSNGEDIRFSLVISYENAEREKQDVA